MGRRGADHTGKYKTCGHCGGVTYIFIPTRDLQNGDREFKQVICPTCEGLGLVDKNRRIDFING